jgi:RNA polymerase sigma factor (sigma-70 family)
VHSLNATRVSRGGPAIVLTGLEFALQMKRPNVYDTHRPAQPQSASASATMDESAVERTTDLVEKAKSGDRAALDRICTRFLPALRRWASGRLPRWSRDLMDTDDLVQETVIRAVKRMSSFESRHDGALQAYLRQAVVNRIRDEIRRAGRSPATKELDENQRDAGASPLEQAIGHEALDRYEAALARLRPEEREAIVARIEMECSYQEVAQAIGKPSADAARMTVSRALLKLAEEMNRGQA